VAAYRAYPGSDLGLDRCIVFLVQGEERNIFDQRHLEYEVARQASDVAVFRLPFNEILDRTTVAGLPERPLLYSPPGNPSRRFEVAVVYFRAGYGPDDYPTPSSWEARYQVERSRAIKCPTVLLQMAGTKKVQQVLATPQEGSSPSELGRFVPDASEAGRAIRNTFTHIYPLDESASGLRARGWATDARECLKYVLKPQREGGGNNYYKGRIAEHLGTLPRDRWKSYILMELITPPPVTNTILRNGQVEEGGVICELGVFGACVWHQGSGEILYNEEAGYLLRTKGDQSEEGGVAAGFGCMDSCNLA
jgi:glutathione synthase